MPWRRVAHITGAASPSPTAPHPYAPRPATSTGPRQEHHKPPCSLLALWWIRGPRGAPIEPWPRLGWWLRSCRLDRQGEPPTDPFGHRCHDTIAARRVASAIGGGIERADASLSAVAHHMRHPIASPYDRHGPRQLARQAHVVVVEAARDRTVQASGQPIRRSHSVGVRRRTVDPSRIAGYPRPGLPPPLLRLPTVSFSSSS